jgi:hypothetical protein
MVYDALKASGDPAPALRTFVHECSYFWFPGLLTLVPTLGAHHSPFPLSSDTSHPELLSFL